MGIARKYVMLAFTAGCLVAAGAWAGWAFHKTDTPIEASVAAAPQCVAADCFWLWAQRDPTQAGALLQADIGTVLSRAAR